jgi:hypothetical protein
MADKDNWASKLANSVTGGKDGEGWGVSTSGLVVFLIVLMVSVIMLIVNAVYFFQVYNGSTVDDIDQYWSRGGALTLAIVNIVFGVLLGIEFFIVLKILLTRSQINDPTCISAIGGAIDPRTGLPNENLAMILDGKDLAYASSNPNRSGYVSGIKDAGALDTSGLYIGGDNLISETRYRDITSDLTGRQLTTAEENLTAADTNLRPAAAAFSNIPTLTATLTAAEAGTVGVGATYADADAKALAVQNARTARDAALTSSRNLSVLSNDRAIAAAKVAEIQSKISRLSETGTVLRTDSSRNPPLNYLYYPYSR